MERRENSGRGKETEEEYGTTGKRRGRMRERGKDRSKNVGRRERVYEREGETGRGGRETAGFYRRVTRKNKEGRRKRRIKIKSKEKNASVKTDKERKEF